MSRLWNIKEHPGYQVELINGWTLVLWGPCCDNDECPLCGGTNSRILETRGASQDSVLLKSLITDILGEAEWTTERVQ